MIKFTNIGTEASLTSLYPKIDEFYEKELKFHRIHVSDNLILSAVELKAPQGAPGTTLQDSSHTLVIVPGRAETEHKYAELLYDQALLIAGLPLEDPTAYAERVCSLMK